MKKIILGIFAVLSIGLTAAAADAIVGDAFLKIRKDWRTMFPEYQQINGYDVNAIILDSRRLIRVEADRFRDKFEFDDVFFESNDFPQNLSELLENFEERFSAKLGSFLKPSSTIVKVVRKNEINLYVWRKAVKSNVVLNNGDIVILQDLGDLL